MNFSSEDWTYMTLPVLGDPDPADPTQSLPVVRRRKTYVPCKDGHAEQYAVVELQGDDPIDGTELRYGTNAEDWGTAFFIFKRTTEATPGDVIAVLHQHKLTVRYYEPLEDGQICLRSVEQRCPTWTLPADEVKIQGVVVRSAIDLHDSGWA